MNYTSQHNRKSERGFGVIGVILVLLIVTLIAGLGGYLYHREHKSKTDATISNNSTSSSNTSSNKPKPASDPYNGWKQYCDTASHYCFKYPSTWVLLTNPDQVTVLNPAKNTEVDYVNPYVHDGGLLAFTSTDDESLTVTGMHLKVVGGVYLPANEPDYGVVDASLLSTYPLTVGQQTQFPNALRFTDTHASGSPTVEFRARATSAMASEAQAQAWFNSTDAQTSLLILKSLSYSQ